MPRTTLKVVVALVLLACGANVVASERVDQDTLRKELAELKLVAAELAERIAKLEERLPLQKNDLVVVEMDAEPSKSMVYEHRQPTRPKEKLTWKMKAVVTDVLPNGDCVLCGEQRFTSNDTVVMRRLTGIAPQKDFDECRTINYSAIIDFKINTTTIRNP